MFHNRDLLIVGKHGKEQVIAPVLGPPFSLTIHTTTAIDTDALGTFSGEIPRLLSPVEALRKKCDLGWEHMGIDLVLASEGSFGPHPSLAFMPMDEEWMLLKDYRHGFELLHRYHSLDTNFERLVLERLDQVPEFLERVGFPEHGLILMEPGVFQASPWKDLRDQKALMEVLEQVLARQGSAILETDMRAMRNPKRMRVIEALAKQLLTLMQSPCPQCQKPGFGRKERIPGLPCEQCGQATQGTLKYRWACPHCACTKEEIFPDKKEKEAAQFCDICNP